MFIGCAATLLRPAAAAGGLRPQDVFATTLYSGDGTAKTITTGVDLTGGGTIWEKPRQGTANHRLTSANRLGLQTQTDTTAAESSSILAVSTVSATGYTSPTWGAGNNIASWSFKKAAKFYTEVVYTGDGTTGRQIAHDLGIAPGMIVVKRLDATGSWYVQHVSLGPNQELYLEQTSQSFTSSKWGGTAPTSTAFTVNTTLLNASGGTYLARIWAHDPDTTNGIIQCGSGTVALPRPPQWVLYKDAGATGNWTIIDSTRGFTLGLNPNLSNAEAAASGAAVSGSTITFTGMTTPIWCAIYAPF